MPWKLGAPNLGVAPTHMWGSRGSVGWSRSRAKVMLRILLRAQRGDWSQGFCSTPSERLLVPYHFVI